MNRLPFALAALLVGLLLAASPGRTAPVVQTISVDGEVVAVGVTDLVVEGVAYDVSFEVGTLDAIWPESAADPTFWGDEDGAEAAAIALAAALDATGVEEIQPVTNPSPLNLVLVPYLLRETATQVRVRSRAAGFLPSLWDGWQARTHEASVATTLTFAVFTPAMPTVEDVAADIETLIDADPGSDVADKLEDVLDRVVTASEELEASPPDNQAAVGALEGAAGDLEAAVDDGVLSAATGTALMEALADVARGLAEEAIEAATDQGGDPEKIEEAEQALAEGGDLRDDGDFKDAVAAYKDALAIAEGELD